MYKILICVCLMFFDFCTGLLNAFFKGNLKSYKMREGGKHKSGELIAILFTIFIDQNSLKFGIDLPFSLSQLTTTYIFIMESLSIWENLNLLTDNKLPNTITKFFKNLKIRR